MHFVNCKRILREAKIRFVKEAEILFLFFDLVCCFGFQKQLASTLYHSKLLQNWANSWNLVSVFAKFRPVCEIHLQIKKHVHSKPEPLQILRLYAESAKFKRNPQIVNKFRKL